MAIKTRVRIGIRENYGGDNGDSEGGRGSSKNGGVLGGFIVEGYGSVGNVPFHQQIKM